MHLASGVPVGIQIEEHLVGSTSSRKVSTRAGYCVSDFSTLSKVGNDKWKETTRQLFKQVSTAPLSEGEKFSPRGYSRVTAYHPVTPDVSDAR